ncbi:MaoC/PaaZ C-terminal domain-containing protein [Variovorax sp. LjRoot290]|uniref:MaoC/PaaZ C-terminal domain-containing protein n=1 Tax=unclassified Variovorax TaxID=663243 RepID=UPI003ECE2C45
MSRPSTPSFEVGAALPELVVPPLTRATLALYAGASGDHVPLHIDTDAARKAGAPDVFGHGMLSAAWLGRLLTNWVEQERIRSIELRFVGIFQLYNEAHCSGRVVEQITLDGGERAVRVEIHLNNQYGEAKVLGEAVVSIGELQ